jgi:urease accessory protein
MQSANTSSLRDEEPVRHDPRPEAGLKGFLRFEAAPGPGGRTVLAQQAFRAPFHLGKPYWDGRVLQVQVVNPTAGILAGDRLELAVRVAGGAALLMTTPAATRAFMMRSGTAECRQNFTVAAGGWLEYGPEPLCPHRESDYSQVSRIEIAEGGETYWVDALAPGRAGRGELWAWRRLRIGLEVVCGGELVLREQLDSSGTDMARAAAFHGTPGGWLATVLILTPRLGADDGIWEQVRALHGGGRWVGVTRLRRGGSIVRAVATDGQDLRDLLRDLRRLLAAALPHLGSDPRKL